MNGLLRSSTVFCKRNASTILTCMGGAGAVATTVMAVKATPKALQLIEDAKQEKGEKLTKMEVVLVTGKVYMPAVIVGVGTLACIFGANTLNKRTQASLMSAYALLDSSFKEYKGKLTELYGTEADEKIKEELVKDDLKDSEMSFEGDKRLFYDELSREYFEATMEQVKDAEYNINRQIHLNGGATLNEFYNFLGIGPRDFAEELGWSQAILSEMYWTEWLDFNHHNVTMDDGLECCIISTPQAPVVDYDYY